MELKELYPNIKLNIEIQGITCDSRKVNKDYIFVAIKGKKTDGNKFIDEAIRNGASIIVTNKIHFKENFIYSANPKLEYIRLLKIFYKYRKIYTIGITGTDGKTTSSTILYSILNELNPSAYIGTNGISYLKNNIPTKNTTPSPEIFYKANNEFQACKVHDLVMEVSSEGILDKRVEGINYDGAIFTNLSHEHLNTHKNMKNYFLCKAKLFESLDRTSLLVINIDDPYSKKIPKHTDAKIITYGFKESATYSVHNYKITAKGSIFEVYYNNKFLSKFHIYLFGKYNIYNALSAIAYAYEIGIPINYIQSGLHKIHSVNGRFMVYKNNDVEYIIDYAHTPNALKNLLDNVNEIKKGKTILVLGAAGEKDSSKRQALGEIATTLADITIFTSEDPKNESIFQIMSDLTSKVKGDYYLTLSRFDAIKLAKSLANKNDIVLITGKGNEKTEIIKNFIFHHSDSDLLKKALGNP